MSEWDKLWAEPWGSYTKYCTTEYDEYETWVNQVNAVGDEMQNDARKYRLLQEDDPDASIVISDELNEACLELDELRQKLEAIRGLVVAVKTCLSSIVLNPAYENAERVSPTMEYMVHIYNKALEILEVLGDE